MAAPRPTAWPRLLLAVLCGAALGAGRWLAVGPHTVAATAAHPPVMHRRPLVAGPRPAGTPPPAAAAAAAAAVPPPAQQPAPVGTSDAVVRAGPAGRGSARWLLAGILAGVLAAVAAALGAGQRRQSSVGRPAMLSVSGEEEEEEAANGQWAPWGSAQAPANVPGGGYTAAAEVWGWERDRRWTGSYTDDGWGPGTAAEWGHPQPSQWGEGHWAAEGYTPQPQPWERAGGGPAEAGQWGPSEAAAGWAGWPAGVTPTAAGAQGPAPASAPQPAPEWLEAGGSRWGEGLRSADREVWDSPAAAQPPLPATGAAPAAAGEGPGPEEGRRGGGWGAPARGQWDWDTDDLPVDYPRPGHGRAAPAPSSANEGRGPDPDPGAWAEEAVEDEGFWDAFLPPEAAPAPTAAAARGRPAPPPPRPTAAAPREAAPEGGPQPPAVAREDDEEDGGDRLGRAYAAAVEDAMQGRRPVPPTAVRPRRLVYAVEDPKVKSFRDLGVDYGLCEALQHAGFAAPTRVQAGAYRFLVRGDDVVLGSETGSGKTLAYLVPAMQRMLRHSGSRVRVLILQPFRDLTRQVTRMARDVVEPLNALQQGLPGRATLSVENLSEFGDPNVPPSLEADLTVSTPDKLKQYLPLLPASPFDVVVLDEVDWMMGSGRHDVEAVLPFLRRLPPADQSLGEEPQAEERRSPQFVAVGSTMPGYLAPGAENLRSTLLEKWPDATWIRTEGLHKLPATLEHHFLPVTLQNRTLTLLQHVEEILADPQHRLLVFTTARTTVEDLTRILQDAGHPARPFHKYVPQDERYALLDAVRRGDADARLVVSSPLAARGVDLPSVTHVLAYEFPANAVEYVHTLGRTARHARPGTAVCFFLPEEAGLVKGMQLLMERDITLERAFGRSKRYSIKHKAPLAERREAAAERRQREKQRAARQRRRGPVHTAPVSPPAAVYRQARRRERLARLDRAAAVSAALADADDMAEPTVEEVMRLMPGGGRPSPSRRPHALGEFMDTWEELQRAEGFPFQREQLKRLTRRIPAPDPASWPDTGKPAYLAASKHPRAVYETHRKVAPKPKLKSARYVPFAELLDMPIHYGR